MSQFIVNNACLLQCAVHIVVNIGRTRPKDSIDIVVNVLGRTRVHCVGHAFVAIDMLPDWPLAKKP